MPTAGSRLRAQPHDSLVRFVFTQRDHGMSFLKSTFPAALVEAIDWSSLKIEKDTFVDEALRRFHSDLVYSATMGGDPVVFYTLFEHQSTVDPLMVYRMGQYMWRLWEHLIRQDPARVTLPPIVPVLLHHGPRGWTAATAFSDIVCGSGPARDAIAHHIPKFEVRLTDLTTDLANVLASGHLSALVRLSLWCLSVAHDDDRFVREIDRMGEVIRDAWFAPDGRAALAVILRYITGTHDRLRPEKVLDLVKNAASPKNEQEPVDVWDHFWNKFRAEARREGKREGREEGKREGLKEGKREGLKEGKREGLKEGKREGLEEGKREGLKEGKREGMAEALLRLLAARFGEVPASVGARIRSATEAQLTAWTGAILTAPSLEALLEATPPTKSEAARARSKPTRKASAAAPKRRRASPRPRAPRPS